MEPHQERSDNTNLTWHPFTVTVKERARNKGQRPVVLWFTGLSGSGKSTIANAVEKLLLEDGKHSYLLDGDNIRLGLNKDLDFSEHDRVENIRRIGEVAKLFVDSGTIVITAFISPFIQDRQQVKKLFSNQQFLEVFIDTPLDVCESRDPKGLYKKARKGEIQHFTGIDSAYEPPVNPDIHIHPTECSILECASIIIDKLREFGYLEGEH